MSKYMTPAAPAFVRPNPLLRSVVRRRPQRTNPLFGGGRVIGPLGGAAVGIGLDMVIHPITGRKWSIPVHVGLGLLSAGFGSSPFQAGFAGGQFYAALTDLLQVFSLTPPAK